jgi:hypothetical protein
MQVRLCLQMQYAIQLVHNWIYLIVSRFISFLHLVIRLYDGTTKEASLCTIY